MFFELCDLKCLEKNCYDFGIFYVMVRFFRNIGYKSIGKFLRIIFVGLFEIVFGLLFREYCIGNRVIWLVVFSYI